MALAPARLNFLFEFPLTVVTSEKLDRYMGKGFSFLDT